MFLEQDYEVELTEDQLLKLGEDHIIGPKCENTEQDLMLAASEELEIEAELLVEDELKDVFPTILKLRWSEYPWQKIEDFTSTHREHKYLIVDTAEAADNKRAESERKIKAHLAEYREKRLAELRGNNNAEVG